MPVGLHTGYRISDRLSLQVGVAYGGDRDEATVITQGTEGIPIENHSRSKTQAVAIPVTINFTFLKALQRFPVYATATVMPAFRRTIAENEPPQANVAGEKVRV
ncbi:hypothetical protein ACFSKU_07545 [Pontibacter silvestris]|uniref:Outer membrane protein beta-barrel domain-containing protein n=1 Tax=Pontibacter silvestris TaxID=2305183 RepID=A0ABW4WWE9_9BACT|nr:hypothetical protein [Pontibacter silvestris]MCC9136644.1 hypothetical protein [Pontibacter silvestris]